jgi:starch synthase (maltosyl-transferring)
MKPIEGRKRVVIEVKSPKVECGRYPARRFLGDSVTVTAAVFGDGHDHVSGQVHYRAKGERSWRTAPLVALGNDLYSASFAAETLGAWSFAVEGWIDHFGTWCYDLKKRLAAQPEPPKAEAAGDSSAEAKAEAAVPAVLPAVFKEPQDIPLALRTGALLIAEAAMRAKGADALALLEVKLSLEWLADQNVPFYEYPLTAGIEELVNRYFNPDLATRTEEFPVWVDRVKARYSTWYELFPRSASPDGKRHGTFADVETHLPRIAAMGFDVLYMPPISPIGEAFRKGPNNSVTAQPGDEGSPWAVGSADGGHTAIHKKLGTMKDFESLVAAAGSHGIEIALDIAFQCSPDHPWVKEHPDWFSIRPDGTIQYAENPPKKYQDIYPLNFESADWRALWENLHEVFAFWIRHGVSIFRVDNPHTKALPFWEWVIGEIHAKHPEVIFLAEAFTRPHVMYALAKGGFTQSYTYFTWRTAKAEIEQYFEEITKPPVSDFFTPNVWPNTPDILHASLQEGGRPAFMQRLILAATLAASYGIYGPAYELGWNTPAKKVSEEYLDSEKYQIRKWELDGPQSIAPLITRVNQIRRENAALQGDLSLHFHPVDNPMVMCYHKRAAGAAGEPDNIILVAINLDPKNEQAGWIDLDLKALGIAHDETFDVEDLLTGVHYKWHDRSNYVALRPDVLPAHVFRVTHVGAGKLINADSVRE